MNEQNLRPFTSEQSREEAAKNGAKGGKASGEARRRKADMRRAMEDMLFRTYKDKATGATLTGLEAITASLITVAMNPKNKNSVAAYKEIAEITGQQEAGKIDDIDDETRDAIAEMLRDVTNRQGKRDNDIE